MQAGESIQGHRLVNHLGDGGMASVWRAVRADGRWVAIKLLDEKLARRPQFRQRFFAEGELQSKLRHPNVVRVEQILLDPLALVMELVEGGTLAAELRRGRPDHLRVRQLMAGITAGVGAAHRAGIIHRDLKPQNVLLDPGGVPKVADFGLAKVAGIEGLTRTGQVMGTLKYMAPEQFQGLKTIDRRADVYALGIILYQMLAGRVPFTGSEFELGDAHVRVQPPDPRQFAADVPEALVVLLEQALAKDPAQRPADALVFGQAVEAAFEQLLGSTREQPLVVLPSAAPAPADVSIRIETPLPVPAAPEEPPPEPPAPAEPVVPPRPPERDSDVPPSVSDGGPPPPAARSVLRVAVPVALVVAALGYGVVRWMTAPPAVVVVAPAPLPQDAEPVGPDAVQVAAPRPDAGAVAAPVTMAAGVVTRAAPPTLKPLILPALAEAAPPTLEPLVPPTPVKAAPPTSDGTSGGPEPDPVQYQAVMQAALTLVNDGRYADAVAPLLQAQQLQPTAALPHKALCAVLPEINREPEGQVHCRLWLEKATEPGDRAQAQALVDKLDAAGPP